MTPRVSLLVAVGGALLAQTPSVQDQALMKQVSAQSLKAHVSFLASDALEGRDTPSKGLEVAAEYIAAQFRRMGLEPAGTNGYFQPANFGFLSAKTEGLNLAAGGLDVPVDKIAVDSLQSAAVTGAPLVKVRLGEEAPLAAAGLAGKAVWIEMPDFNKVPAEQRSAVFSRMSRDRELLRKSGAALVIAGASGMGRGSARSLRDLSETAPPQITLRDSALAAQWRALAEGTPVTAAIPAPGVERISVRNVAGILRGSDPALRDTCVLVTAHYDHIGARTAGEGDLINNGANDDASGTATVIELAEAFLRAGAKPKRSILFVTFFGEERGLLGARFYARNPLVPIKQTIANFNFEHMGRTDDSEGPRLRKFNLTGFDFSTFTATVKAGAARAGVEVWKHEKNSDAFFGASDNAALADVGIPAHTASVTYTFPDYHQAGDHWDKIDYTNMQTVVQGAALALLDLANAAMPPAWDKSNPRAARYAQTR